MPVTKQKMLQTIEELRQWSLDQRTNGLTIGLVPTMGALHNGHLSLVRESMKRCDKTIVSIFVNPSQFAPDEDFHKYPRPLENDLKLLSETGAPEVFVPSVEEMYPADFDASVHVGGVSVPFEGQLRPTHFDGVATVVLKLFNASQAHQAFFGQKDFQQVCVIKKMAADLNVPVEIIVCPIIREPDGLAMSSRNQYLSVEHRKQAVALSQSILLAEELIVTKKERRSEVILDAVRQKICTGTDFVLDYAVLADVKTLRELDVLEPETTPQAVLLLAARLGTTRLLDNAVFDVFLQ